MRICQSLEIEQTIELDGGMTSSVFPKLEKLLNDSEYWKSLEYIGKRRDQDPYKSIIDFVLCEVMPQYKDPCLRFYHHDGPAIRELESDEDIRKIEGILLVFVSIAYHYFCEDREISWSRAVLETTKLLENL